MRVRCEIADNGSGMLPTFGVPHGARAGRYGVAGFDGELDASTAPFARQTAFAALDGCDAARIDLGGTTFPSIAADRGSGR